MPDARTDLQMPGTIVGDPPPASVIHLGRTSLLVHQITATGVLRKQSAIASSRLTLILYDPKTKSVDVQRWLNAAAYVARLPRRQLQVGPHRHAGGRAALRYDHDANPHDSRVKAICLTVDDPIASEALDEWLDALVTIKGPDLLRVKGILNIANRKGPVAIHGVQHIFHPPVRLAKWPSDDRRSRHVVIAKDIG